MIVTYIHSNHPADQFRVQLRCRNFVDAINRMGRHHAHLLDLDSFIQHSPEAQKICSGSDVLILHRYLYGAVLQSIQYWKARDKKILVDFDQAINYLTTDIPCSSFWLNHEPAGARPPAEMPAEAADDSTPLEQFRWGLRLVDAAIVPSTRLMIDWMPFAEVYEVPDYLNADQYPASKQAHENDIWIGVANHARTASLKNSGLLKALESVCKSRPHVRLILPDSEGAAVEKSNLPSSQVVRYCPHSFEAWADILLKLDIGLVPVHGEYDLRLGRESLLEFMISKTPWIASDQPGFRELSRYGKLVPNAWEAWEAVILKFADHIDIMQKRAAGEPFLFALSQDIRENIDKVLRLYTHILSQTQRSGVR